MKGRVEIATLSRAVEVCALVAKSKSVKPTCQRLLLTPLGGKFSIRANDCEVAVEVIVDGDGFPAMDQPAFIEVTSLLSAMRSFQLSPQKKVALGGVRSGPCAARERDPEDASLHLHVPDASLRLRDDFGVYQDEIPKMQDVDAGVQYEIAADSLLRLIDQTRFAVAKEGTEQRPMFHAILLHLEEGRWESVSTDGKRLAIASCSGPEGRVEMQLPQVLMDLLAKTVGRVTGTAGADTPVVQLTVGDGRVRVDLAGIRIIALLRDGEFPPYREVLPKEAPKNRISIDRALLVSQVNKVLAVSPVKDAPIALAFGRDRLQLHVQDPVGGTADGNLPLESDIWCGEATIGVNAKFLLEGLKPISGVETVTIDFRGSKEAIVIRDPEGNNYTYMLMPIGLIDDWVPEAPVLNEVPL
jgi:DNA polymerase III sliding clamp (beta) subunit (PCNA family)